MQIDNKKSLPKTSEEKAQAAVDGLRKTAGKKMKIYLKDGKAVELSPTEIVALQKTYGKNWLKKIKSVPLPDQRKKRDKKRAKAAKKARKLNRKKR